MSIGTRLDSVDSVNISPLVRELRTERVQRLIQERRRRAEFFRRKMFCDPAWDMLLALYASHLSQQRLTVSRLAEAADLPLTTTLRWIRAFEGDYLLSRQIDPGDARRVFVELAPTGLDAMNGYFRCGPGY